MRRPGDGERGQALVEFALVLPLLCLLLFGIVEFGLMFFKYVDLTSAARDGARQVSVVTDGGQAEQVATAAVQDSSSAFDDGQTTVQVTTDGAWQRGATVHVKVSHPYRLEIMGLSLWNGPMTAESVAKVE
ncbi:MAG TPA: TadE/TadG family type IV pilus assembly protein [Solirubrobacteraceae bacterium]|nr:TadE/TadG family type IV pilus assembly protein [Solirubrobacteraceae bacterium]